MNFYETFYLVFGLAVVLVIAATAALIDAWKKWKNRG